MKTLLLSSLVAVSTAAFAQITVNSTHVANIGAIVLQAEDTMPSGAVMPGAAGANQTWNLSALANHRTDTLKFTQADWLPNFSHFPTSNLAVDYLNNSSEGYMRNTSTELLALGQVGDLAGMGDTMVVKVNPAEKIMVWPATFNSTFNDSFVIDMRIDGSAFGVDSVRLKSYTRKTVTVDGWGSLTTPLGTYNTLRSLNASENTDSIWAYSAGIGWFPVGNSTDSSYRYSWWTNDSNIGFPLAELEYDPATASVLNANWLSSVPTQTTGIPTSGKSNFRIYPNPVSGNLSIEVNPSTYTKYTVTDLSGKVIFQNQVTENITSLNVESLAPGTYILRAEGVEVRVEKFIKN